MTEQEHTSFIKHVESILNPTHHPCEGLPPDLIDEVAADQGVRLPYAYRAFLEIAGRRCGNLWVGTDAFYPEIIGLRRDAIELLEANAADVTLDRTCVVIAMHQGYQFLYLRGDGNDPPVYRYLEGGRWSALISDRFTDFVTTCMHELDRK